MNIFHVTEGHLKLLRKAYVSWNDCEYGAPCIDPKRPYGNSDVVGDMAEIILGEEEGREDLTEEQEDWLRKLHEETETVLQIGLRTGQFKVGAYKDKSKYGSGDWEEIREDNK